MISSVNFEAILQQLSATQVNQLTRINPDTSGFIYCTRERLPRTFVDYLRIHKVGENKFELSPSFIDDVQLTGEEIMNFVKPLEVGSLNLDAEALPFMEKSWLRGIEEICCYGFKDEESIKRFTKNLNCSELILIQDFEIDGLKVLENMPFVTKLELHRGNFDEKFFDKLAEKSKRGPGIESVRLVYGDEEPFTEELIIDFVENAKFKIDNNETEDVTLNIVMEEIPDSLVEKVQENVDAVVWGTYGRGMEFNCDIVCTW